MHIRNFGQLDLPRFSRYHRFWEQWWSKFNHRGLTLKSDRVTIDYSSMASLVTEGGRGMAMRLSQVASSTEREVSKHLGEPRKADLKINNDLRG